MFAVFRHCLHLACRCAECGDTRRLQASPPDTYRNAWHCFRSILKYEGVRGLYRGVSAPLIGGALETGMPPLPWNVFPLCAHIKHRLSPLSIAGRLMFNEHYAVQVSITQSIPTCSGRLGWALKTTRLRVFNLLIANRSAT